jgi:uncharacterized membrane protein
MRYVTLRKWQAAIGGVMGGIIGGTLFLDNWVIPTATILAGIILMYALRRRVTEIVDDERTYAIAYRAARLTVAVVAIGMALVGALFLFFGRGGASPELTHTGFALEFTTCALLVVNQLAYYYYRNKTSGRS